MESIVDGDDISDASFPFSSTKLFSIDGNLVRGIRLSFVGELGYEIQIPLHLCDKVYRVIVEAGKKYDMKLAGYRALYSLSSEKGEKKIGNIFKHLSDCSQSKIRTSSYF